MSYGGYGAHSQGTPPSGYGGAAFPAPSPSFPAAPAPHPYDTSSAGDYASPGFPSMPGEYVASPGGFSHDPSGASPVFPSAPGQGYGIPPSRSTPPEFPTSPSELSPGGFNAPVGFGAPTGSRGFEPPAPSAPYGVPEPPSFRAPSPFGQGIRGPSPQLGAPRFPGSHPLGTPLGHAGPPPPSGFRVPLTAGQPFPEACGPPPAFDSNGMSPVFIGSAILGNSVHPCKICPSLHPPARVPYGGRELEHDGRYDLLPFDPNLMEWVWTSRGRIPGGRRPVEGGYEDHGGKLYHALASVNGVKVPGKTGEHLGAAHVAFGGAERDIKDNYEILCWKH